MEAFLHLFGFCADAKFHLDLIDILLLVTANSGIILYIKYKWKLIKEKVKLWVR